MTETTEFAEVWGSVAALVCSMCRTATATR